MSEPKSETSLPGTRGYGGDSPVIRTSQWLRRFLDSSPKTNLGTESVNSNALLLANHLLHLLEGCGLLNGTGYHSAAVTLFRPMEDALDTFAAVALVKGCAEQWESGKLKASDAAKAWIAEHGDVFVCRHNTIAEYRKVLRSTFNDYSHCSRQVCLWNLYFNVKKEDPSTGKLSGTLDLNTQPLIIDRNGHSIDAFETAHLLEFLELLRKAYSDYLRQYHGTEELELLVEQTQQIMERHDSHRCQEVRIPPEIARLEK
jgi:hypothetical protein